MKRFSTPRLVLLLLCAMYFMLFVVRTNIATTAPLMQKELHLSNTELGLVFSAFAFPYALFQLFGGWIGDKFGPRRTLAVCCAIVALGIASLAWLVVWVWFYRNDPREHPSITDEELATLPARTAYKGTQAVPWLRLARRILPVTAVDFCYGWTLWLFLSWIPSFFYGNYHLNLQSTAIF